MFKGDRDWRTMYNINLYTNAEGKEERDPWRPKSLSSSTSDNGHKLNTKTRICNGKYLALAGEEHFAGMGDSDDAQLASLSSDNVISRQLVNMLDTLHLHTPSHITASSCITCNVRAEDAEAPRRGSEERSKRGEERGSRV